ncbi:MAG: TonB-dependent receptor-like protein [Gammaproteobacteria bacterium]|nr:TonB-dependent receptor-like protein [Gammaproteobacteria bacterium]
MSHRYISIKSRILTLSSAAVLTLSGFIANPVFAQADDASGAKLEEITVTGSRIVRRDFVSNSPIVTVDAEAFEQQTGLNIESYLNQLPEYNPAASPVTTQGDVQITPVNSVGVASISLRGFGPNRSLVLIDGKRPVPVNALMVQDINGIPSSLIQRVETITGGASAVYGADAVGGVTNFILRKDYEGFEFDGQYGTTEAGDGEENRISALFGANFADDRGNVTMGVERYNREEANQIERDIYTDVWQANDTNGYFFFHQGANGYNCLFNCPAQATVNSIFGDGTATGNPFSPLGANVFRGYRFNPDGTIYVAGSQLGESRNQYNDGLEYATRTALDATDPSGNTVFNALKWNNLRAYASAPQDRYSLFASGHFDVTDTISVKAGVRFAESNTATLLFGTNAIFGWEATVPYTAATDSPYNTALINETLNADVDALRANPAAYPNPTYCAPGATLAVNGTPCTSATRHAVPLEVAILLNSRPNPAGYWQPEWNPEDSLPPRQTQNTISTWQYEGGVDFEIPFRDWSGEVYFSHGESNTYNVAGGNMSLSRYRMLVNMPDWGRNPNSAGIPQTISGNSTYISGTDPDGGGAFGGPATAPTSTAQSQGFGAGDVKCTSGFYNTLFAGDQPLSDDCYNAINAVLQTRTEIDQDIVEVNLQGGVIDLPAGEARAAVGYQHRAVNGKFNPDILQSEDSFTDQVIGVYPTGYLDAATHVNDGYVEALVPIVKDLPYMQKFEVETGARYSSYEETGDNEWTYKLLGSWEVKDWFRIRGGFNRATRAPNLGELFLNPQEIFTIGGNFGDPCSVRANAPFGAGGFTGGVDPVVTPGEPALALAAGQTQAGADRTQDICVELMGGAGSAAANQYYNVTNAAVQGGGGGFAWVLQQGNAELSPETADTWTGGFVMSSPFENPWLSGASVNFDWYKVKITNAIMTYSIDYANYRCFGVDTGLSPAAQAATPGCQLTQRNTTTGGALATTLSYDNQATIKTSGFDIGFNWFSTIADLGFDVPGALGFNLNTTVLHYYTTKQSPAVYDVETEWKGSLGPNLPGTQAGAYDYRMFGNLSYNLDNWGVNFRWRHLPSVWTAGYASQQAIIENNANVTAGGDGILLSYVPTTEIETNSYDVFDFSATWDINEIFSVRAGVTNLFDTDPEVVGATAGYAPGSDISAATVCGGAPGCGAPGGYSVNNNGGGLAPFFGGYYDTLGRRFFVGMQARF